MNILSFSSGLVMAAFGMTASAHAHLQSSSPADNGVITTPPSSLVLNFSEAARLTALSIQKDGEPGRQLNPLPAAAARQISVPLPRLTPGIYSVSWHVLSEDGHVTSGIVHFTLAPAQAADHPADHSARH